MDHKKDEQIPLKVLHLEDSPQDAEIIRELLIDADIDLSIDSAATEKKFVSMLRSRKYDIILADFKLSGFDAFGALRWASEISPGVPFICVSGTVGEETAAELIRQGADDYVIKDRLNRLPSAIKRAIDEAKEKAARKQAEETLRESKEKYHTIFENIQDVYYETAMDGTILEVSPSITMLSKGQYHREDIIGKSMSDFYSDVNERNMLLVNLKEHGSVTDYEISLRNHNGSLMVCSISARLLFNDQQQPVKITGIMRSIAERKQAEKALKNSETFLDSIIEYSPHAMWISDSKGTLIRLNQACRDLLHITNDEVVGKYNIFHDAIVAEQGFLPRVSQVFEQGTIARFTTVYDSRRLQSLELGDHVSLVLDITISPILNADGQVIHAIIQIVDNTQREQAREQIRKSLKEKEVLIRELYHRTKNNMQVICSLLRLQSSKLEDEKAKVLFKELETRIYSMALVHQQLLGSKDLSHLNLKDYIGSLISHLKLSYTEFMKKISIHTKMEDVTVLIDTAMPLGLVFNELISNVVKHAFPDNKRGEIKVNLCRGHHNEVILEMSDNGIGFPEGFEIKNDIHFGLETVIDLVEQQLEGEIVFESRKGVHCRITIIEELYKARV